MGREANGRPCWRAGGGPACVAPACTPWQCAAECAPRCGVLCLAAQFCAVLCVGENRKCTSKSVPPALLRGSCYTANLVAWHPARALHHTHILQVLLQKCSTQC